MDGLYFFFILTFLCYSFYIFFSKKLVALLILESLMIFLIFSYFNCSTSCFFCLPIGVLFSCFMVLDSVFGVSILICCSRSGGSLGSSSLVL